MKIIKQISKAYKRVKEKVKSTFDNKSKRKSKKYI